MLPSGRHREPGRDDYGSGGPRQTGPRQKIRDRYGRPGVAVADVDQAAAEDDRTMSTIETITPSRPCIVAGFDNSPSGYDAVALGRTLAIATGARLIVANVYPLAAELVLDSKVDEKLRQDALRTARRAHIVLEGFDDWDPHACAAAPAARGLHEVAEREQAEMIVVGSTHRHGLGRVMPGATAEKLLRGAGVPVVVAPAGWSGGDLRTIGAGFDGSRESHAALRAAAALALAGGSDLLALSVFEAPHPANPVFAVTGHGYAEITGEMREEHRRRLEEATESLPSDCACTAAVVEGDPARVLADQSRRLDLLVIGSRGYGAARATLAGTVGHRLATASRCPLMLIPRGVEHPLRRIGAPRRRIEARRPQQDR